MTDPSAKDRKRQLRGEIRRAVLAVPAEQRLAEEDAIRGHFDLAPGLATARNVMMYVSCFADEIDTRPWLERVIRSGQTLISPRVDREARRLRLHVVRDLATDLAVSPGMIPEPSAMAPVVDPAIVDWILVPGVAFDRRGDRLGRGGGYYDRLLAEIDEAVPRWSLALDAQFVDTLPTEPHDRRVHGLIRGHGIELSGH